MFSLWLILVLFVATSIHRYGLMRRCWIDEASNRPTFSKISLQLNEILTENATIYLRHQTSDIADDYYTQPTDVHGKPIYCTDGNSDELSTPE